jgi:hypothetical protein
MTSTDLASDGNPELKVYDIDPDTYEVMDFTVFIGSLHALSYPARADLGDLFSKHSQYERTDVPTRT